MADPDDIYARPFEPDDVDAVRSLIHRTIDACYTDVYPPRAVNFFKEFHSAARIAQRHTRGRVLVACRDGAIVGTGSLVTDEISGMFVDPELQGCGIGSLIMERLEQAASETGYSSAHLDISLPSRAFYEGRGYRILGDHAIAVGNGELLEYWAAKKQLGRNA